MDIYNKILLLFLCVLSSHCRHRRVEQQPRATKIFISSNPIWPVIGRISSPFGMRNGKPHQGIDITAKLGTRVYAALRGDVSFAGWLHGYGNTVIVQHHGFSTLYAHLHSIKVKSGSKVRKGQTIATVGNSGISTGPHLHFEYISKNKGHLDPLILFDSSI